MSSSLDLAGVVGTWVSAFIAVIALVGIVGPLLVWRASRTERHKALNRLGDDTGGFITKGIPATAHIRLFRSVKAPMLQDEPRVAGVTLVWNNAAKQASRASSSWVKIGLVLKAYNFEFQCGDPLTVEDTQTWLPVNRVWIMLLGIIGAFGSRVDQGKLIRRSTGVRSSQAVPGALARGISRPGWKTGLPTWAEIGDSRIIKSSEGEFTYGNLYGIVGALHILMRRSSRTPTSHTHRAVFSNHSSDEIGELLPHRLPLSSLFWLAVGCLPATDGRIFSLEDVLDVPYEQVARETSRPSFPNSPAVHFSESGGHDDWHDDWHHVYEHRIAPNAFVHSPAYITMPNSRAGPRGFRLSVTHERIQALLPLARAVGAETADVFSLVEIELTPENIAEFDQDAGATYWPSNSLWVRMSAGFLWRADAQLLAKVLLQLDLYAQGYLIGGNKSSQCRKMLCNASESLPQLLGRLIRNVDTLGLPPDREAKLLSTMEEMMTMTLDLKLVRALSTAIFELDETLAMLAHPDPKVDIVIGVLMITNPEFRSIIAQSARHIDATINSTVELDLGASSLDVRVAFGAIQPFPIDFDVLFPNEPTGQGVVSIRYSAVILAALKASLRSAFMVTSIDSKPLFELVMDCAEIVQFG